MKTFCLITAVVCGALLCCAVVTAKDMPDFPCTFSTKLVENAEYKTTVSLKERIHNTLMFSRNPQRILAAQEALTKLKNGETVTGFESTTHDEFFWYSIENQYQTVVMDRNMTLYWNSSGVAAQVVPFFDRFFCIKYLADEPPLKCPQSLLATEMKFVEVQPCPNHPGKQCDVYKGSYSSYTQTVLMVKNTNTLDELLLESDDWNYRADYVGFDTSKPDPSYFVVPTKYPVSDFTKVPSSEAKATWSAKKYPGKKFQLNPLSKTLFHSSMQQSFVAPKRSSPRLAVPDSFDARDNWPNCSTIKQIRNQGQCGSCWAFGAAESFGDRYCITTGNSITFSPQFIVDCYVDNDGCGGGYPDLAWMDLIDKGVVSDECRQYYGKNLKCTDVCDDQSAMKKYYAKSAYSPYVDFDINETVRLIQEEIMKNGPVEAAFFVFADFDGYSGGVYQRTTTSMEGGHAVKIIGWGTDKDTKLPYWLIANSWGEDWGENGYFRIRRGTNECGIETEVVAGLVKA